MEQTLPIIALFAVPSAVLSVICLAGMIRAQRRAARQNPIQPMELRPFTEAVNSGSAYSRMAPVYFTVRGWLLLTPALGVGVVAATATVLISGEGGKIGAEQSLIAFLVGAGFVMFVGNTYFAAKQLPFVCLDMPPEQNTPDPDASTPNPKQP